MLASSGRGLEFPALPIFGLRILSRLFYIPFFKLNVANMENEFIIHLPNIFSQANHLIVVIKYDRREDRPVEHFRAEVRAREKELGIPLRNGVQIEDYFGFTSLK